MVVVEARGANFVTYQFMSCHSQALSDCDPGVSSSVIKCRHEGVNDTRTLAQSAATLTVLCEVRLESRIRVVLSGIDAQAKTSTDGVMNVK